MTIYDGYRNKGEFDMKCTPQGFAPFEASGTTQSHGSKAALIGRTFHTVSTTALPNAPGSRKADVAVDVIDELSMALGPKWDVGREIDYVGDVMIIALPADDIDAMPALILYEKDGQAHVATVRGVDWEADHAFSSFRHAVIEMILTAASLVIADQAAGSSYDIGHQK